MRGEGAPNLIEDEDIVSPENVIPLRQEDRTDIPDLTEHAREVDEELERAYDDIRNGVDFDIAEAMERFRRAHSEPSFMQTLARKEKQIAAVMLAFGLGTAMSGLTAENIPLRREIKKVAQSLGIAAPPRTKMEREALRMKEADIQKRIKFLTSKLGEGRMVGFHKKERQRNEVPAVSGFEAFDIPSDVALKVFIDTFPKPWIMENIKSIQYEGREGTVQEAYGGSAAGQPALAEARPDLEDGTTHIEFFAAAQDNSKEAVLAGYGAHEIGHAVDPLELNGLPYERRVYYFSELIRRVEADNRYKSSYVEGIEGEDAQSRILYRAREYWATLFEVYMPDPVHAKQVLSAEDIALVEQYLAETAPGFDATAAAKERREEIFEATDDAKYQHINDILKKTEKFTKERQAVFLTFIRSAEAQVQEQGSVNPEEKDRFLKDFIARARSIRPEWLEAYRAWLSCRSSLEKMRDAVTDVSDVDQFTSVVDSAAEELISAQENLESTLGFLPNTEGWAAQQILNELDDLISQHNELISPQFIQARFIETFPKI